MMSSTEQSAAEYVAVNSQGFVQTLSAVSRGFQGFLRDNPIFLVFLVVLAVVFFGLTRPRTR